MATKYEFYTSGANSQFFVWGVLLQAQSFTPDSTHTITLVKLTMYRAGSPGTIYIAIRATDGSGHPTGPDLANGTTDGNTLTTGSGGEVREIELGAGTALTATTKYCIEMDVPGGGSGGAVSIGWKVNTGGAYAGGETLRFDGVDTWTGYGYDAMFEEWGEGGNGSAYPVVYTQECTGTIAQVSTGWGVINSIGGSAVTQHGHCWNTSTNPTTSDSKTENGAAPNLGQFSSILTVLTPGTTHYVRAYATNSSGTAYGQNVTIVTGTTIGRRHWWTYRDQFHFFGQDGVHYYVQGIKSDAGVPPWHYT